MIGNHQRNTVVFKKVSPEFSNRLLSIEHFLTGNTAHTQNHLWLENFNLGFKEGKTGFLFFGKGIAVLRRTAFYYVCNKAVCVSRKIDGGKHFIKQDSGLSYKRPALHILVVAGTFADNKNIRVRNTFARNDIRAGSGQLAVGTFLDF